MTDARIPIMAQECCEHTESLGELRLICDRLLARLENVEKRVRALEAHQRISYTEPPSFIVTESTKVWVEP